MKNQLTVSTIRKKLSNLIDKLDSDFKRGTLNPSLYEYSPFAKNNFWEMVKLQHQIRSINHLILEIDNEQPTSEEILNHIKEIIERYMSQCFLMTRFSYKEEEKFEYHKGQHELAKNLFNEFAQHYEPIKKYLYLFF